MVELEKKLKNTILELRKEKKRNFNQTVELIINLQKFDARKESLNLFISVPHKIKDKQICAFLKTKNKNVDTVTEPEFKKYSDKKELKKLAKKYDFFISQASLMPKVATTFGRVLGPSGKMPSPQLGIIQDTDEKTINNLKEKINHSVKIRAKEPSIKLGIGKEKMDDEKLVENIIVVYNALVKALQKGKDSVKNIELKFTMSKPQKIDIK